MGKFTATHEINQNQDIFWRLYFDAGLTEKLYRQKLGCTELHADNYTETDTQIIRSLRVTPVMDLPGPVTKLMGSDFRYRLEETFDKATQVLRWKRIPSTMADKLRFEGTIRAEPIGDSKIRRISETVIEAKIFGVGGLMESAFEKQMREHADASAACFNEHIASAAGG